MAALEPADLPYLVCRIDVEAPDWAGHVASQVGSGSFAGVYLLPRRDGLPLDVVILSGVRDLPASDIVGRLASDDMLTSPSGRQTGAQSPIGSASSKPTLTIVICTHGAAPGLSACLAGMVAQTDQTFDVLVVDNTSGRSPEIAAAVDAYAQRLSISLIHQPLVGLSNARNAAVSAVRADLVAWIDDDEEPDESWVAAIRRAFDVHPDVVCMTGRMLPARLQTTTDLLFEEFGGHNKGRSRAETFDKERLGPRIFYPLPPYGAGGNMAMRRAIFQRVPAFDPLLGAGTRCGGGEDTLFFSEILDSGLLLRYEPALVTWHHHRATHAELASQLRSYGRGLGGYYAALCLRSPRRIFALLRLAPRAVEDQYRPTSARNAGHSQELRKLRRGNRSAIVRGAVAYLAYRAARWWRGGTARLVARRGVTTNSRTNIG